ncbi:MAG: aconitate hydratase [Endomicrobia bacterium]|nr:aconitate hydratase [Endomicrobiia bacterium]MDW8055820.1 aconitate hydratase [Elusimicrobiota bacterium]
MKPRLNLTQKIILSHILGNNKKIPEPLEPIKLKIDQTLTQDATGTLAYLQYESIVCNKKNKKVRVSLAVSYVDHNTLQTSFENSDDHKYLQTVAAKYGIIFSPAGNGICHQLHLENFSKPGSTLIGSDSHTPTSSAVGMLAIGVGGLEVACALAGEPFSLRMPKVVNIKLKNKLQEFVSAKDIILYLLKQFTVKGGVNKIFEYTGEGIRILSVYDRATITNMGTELGLTSSIFPSDRQTYKFFKFHNRLKDFKYLYPDEGCSYDEEYELDLAKISPMVAQPHSPDNVVSVDEIEGLKVDQVCIGSCTNSSIKDMIFFSKMLKGRKVNPKVSVIVYPGSRKVMYILEKLGLLENLYNAGVRVMEPVCGACIGQGQAPISAGISLRTFNRNFEGRSGTKDAKVYLSSVEVATAAAIYGEIVHPKVLGRYPKILIPEKINFKPLFIYPPKNNTQVEIFRGPNIKPLPEIPPLADNMILKVLKKLPDNISTDDILPAGTKILSLRSNIPAISKYMFCNKYPEIVTKIENIPEKERMFVLIAGHNYGQGSSREHAAIVQRYNGICVVVAKSFARIHKNNLINFGVVPLEFFDETNYDEIQDLDEIIIENLHSQLQFNTVFLIHKRTNKVIKTRLQLTQEEKDIIIAGGKLNFVREKYCK